MGLQHHKQGGPNECREQVGQMAGRTPGLQRAISTDDHRPRCPTRWVGSRKALCNLHSQRNSRASDQQAEAAALIKGHGPSLSPQACTGAQIQNLFSEGEAGSPRRRSHAYMVTPAPGLRQRELWPLAWVTVLGEGDSQTFPRLLNTEPKVTLMIGI